MNYTLYIQQNTVNMEAKVRKWGNSLGIRIPQSIAEDIGLSQDSVVSLEVRGGELILRPKASKYTLDELLLSIKPENIHTETNWGKPVGKEKW